MFQEVKAINLLNNSESTVKYEPVVQCPCCKIALSPIHISSVICKNNDNFVFFATEFCPKCSNAFISKYYLSNYSNTAHNSAVILPLDGRCFAASPLISCEPNRFQRHIFDEKICSLSPQFDKIYNQALAAESSGLDEIAGLGYRKALEFLIKDYAIHEHPDNTQEIKAKPLAQCIKSYISNESIVTLAERSAWIGNDESHYIRKQEDRDVSDMKAFIQAIVYFIGMILITEDAATMAPVK